MIGNVIQDVWRLTQDDSSVIIDREPPFLTPLMALWIQFMEKVVSYHHWDSLVMKTLQDSGGGGGVGRL